MDHKRCTVAMYVRNCVCVNGWMVVGMGWEWRSECSARAGIILEKVEQGWAVTRAWLSPFPSLSREAQLQLTMTAADCVGYVFVCTCPTSQMDWISPPNLRSMQQQEPGTVPTSENMGPSCIKCRRTTALRLI